ncbi:cytochrome P450 [Streptomyces actinomycinicus]|uniref:Cytochrome P450 n=1 Tax=Streptomyces actinomycinicus TaxID=1695166 RepID=A0A937JKM2_9ACTN|nr:cytochrome P450 [Streptomyces actinomycinicus]MBL1082674.1 cytochrome P450 [Streptomyces actinomycinicus]
MTTGTLSAQILDPANRADPYPLYAELRKQPVMREDDGTYLVSTYHEVRSLANDPRLSQDTRNQPPGRIRHPEEPGSGLPPSFILTDPPLHDRLRATANRPFGPPHSPRFLDGLRGELASVVTGLLDRFDGKDRVDIVDDFSYPLPVTAICRVLGVPREDEPRFHSLADAVASGIDPQQQAGEGLEKTQQARQELGAYLAGLIDAERRHPGPGLLSALAPETGPGGSMTPEDLVATAILLLVAGHETTVNLITNTTLTLLRHPGILERFRNEPELTVPLIEEVLRYEPPVQFVPLATAMADIDLAGTTIPKGSPVWLMIAAANRDPGRFEDPDSFVPDRKDNQHLGFYTGIHYCFGAPLARIEAQLALPELFRRVKDLHLLEDPPPYRANAVLRGPRHLPVTIGGLTG